MSQAPQTRRDIEAVRELARRVRADLSFNETVKLLQIVGRETVTAIVEEFSAEGIDITFEAIAIRAERSALRARTFERRLASLGRPF